MVLHRGGCHCGAIQYEVEAPEDIEVKECNCSICSKSGYLHLIVPAKQFKLVADEKEMALYRFGTHTARHYFCKTCGIKSFYIPRSHPNGVSVNARCLNGTTVKSMKVTPFDGQNWEQSIESLKS